MLTILKIAGLVFESFGNLLSDEYFWIILIIMILLYKRSEGLETTMLGKSFPLFNKVSGSVLVGLAGGMLGSLLVIIVGISIEDYTMTEGGSLASGITYIWLLAILFSLINPRYLCFSYAGGIVALTSLIFGFPDINVPGLLSLIGILHLIESFLIWFDGFTYSVPLFLKKKNGSLVGGYIMNKIWPIPLVVFAVMFGGNEGGASIAGIADMPSWWPFLKHSAAGGARELVYLPLALPVVLGYGDIAMTKRPEDRCASSAVRLAAYSILLIFLSVLASKIRLFAFAAAIFAPVVHELLIIYGAREEETGKPIFENKGMGIPVLYVVKDTPADLMGIEAGDVIVSVNGTRVYEDRQLKQILEAYPSYIWLDLQKTGGREVTVEYSDYKNGVGSLGAMIVPQYPDRYYEMNKHNSVLRKMYNRIKGRNKKGIEM